MSDAQSLNPSDNERAGNAAFTVCPQCAQAVRWGELVCGNCGYMLPATSADGWTRSLPHTTRLQGRRRPVGHIPRHLQRVAFVIAGRRLQLPDSAKLIVGRADPTSTNRDPDVDLAAYGAAEKGVSRYHLKLTWVTDLMYVVDMGSTNGTLLNGQRLLNRIARLLRDGDELTIGHLPVHVRFEDG